MPDDLKILYRLCISKILEVMINTSVLTDLSLNDIKRPVNCNKLLSVMLHYVEEDLKSSNLSLKPSPTDASVTKDLILIFLMCYSDKTIIVSDLIKVGCLEIMMNALTIICE